MNFYRNFLVLVTFGFAVLFVMPVWGQDSYDPTRSTEPGYRFGFGDGHDPQAVEQARKNAVQEAAKQGMDLQFQDPAKLRNQIQELGNRPTVSNDILSDAKDPGTFYVCINKNGNLQKQIVEKILEKQEREILNRYYKDLLGKMEDVSEDELADVIIEEAAIKLGKRAAVKSVLGPLGWVLTAKDVIDILTMMDELDSSLDALDADRDKNNSTETASQESFHYHFYGYRGQFDTGFDETGIHNIGSHNEAKTGNYTKLGGEYEVSIMREANQLLSESGQWTAQSFDARQHNSDHFMSALIKEYDKILRRMQKVTDELFSLPAINKAINSTDDFIAVAKSMDYRSVKDGERKLAALPTKADLERDHCPDDFVDSYSEYVTAISENGVISQSNRDARTRFENVCKSYNIKYPSRERTR